MTLNGIRSSTRSKSDHSVPGNPQGVQVPGIFLKVSGIKETYEKIKGQISIE